MVLSYGKILEPQNEPETPPPPHKGDDFERIVKLSVKSFFWTVTLLSFLLALFVTFFPYPAMKYYTNVGLYKRALETSEAYVKLNEKKYSQTSQPPYDSKFADALLSCVNLSAGLMEETILKEGYESAKAKLYAQKAENHINKYLSYRSLEARSQLLDIYYTSQVSVFSPASRHADFYSFQNYLECMRIRAVAVQKKDVEAFAYFIDLIESPSVSAASDAEIQETSGMFNILTSYLKTKLSMIGWNKLHLYNGLPIESDIYTHEIKAAFTDFSLLYMDRPYAPFGSDGTQYQAGIMPALYRIEPAIDSYKNYFAGLTITSDKRESLKNLYYAKSVKEFIYTVRSCVQVMYLNSGLYSAGAEAELESLYKNWSARLMHGDVSLWTLYKSMETQYEALF